MSKQLQFSNLTSFCFIFQDVDNTELESIGSKISGLITKLENVVSNAVSKAKGKLTGAQTNVDQTAADVKRRTHLALKAQQEAFQNEIDGLKFLGTVDETDECVERNEQSLIELPDMVSENMFQCVDALAQKATDAIKDGYNRVWKFN